MYTNISFFKQEISSNSKHFFPLHKKTFTFLSDKGRTRPPPLGQLPQVVCRKTNTFFFSNLKFETFSVLICNCELYKINQERMQLIILSPLFMRLLDLRHVQKTKNGLFLGIIGSVFWPINL